MRKLNSFLVVAILTLSLLAGSTPAPRAQADEQQIYRVTELPIKVAPGLQDNAVVSGKWVLWHDQLVDQKQINGRNLDTGMDFSFAASSGLVWPVDIGGNVVVAAEDMTNPATDKSSQYGIFGYTLPEGQRFAIAPPKGGDTPGFRYPPRTDGRTVVWAEPKDNGFADIYGYDLAGQRLFPVSVNAAFKSGPAVSGNIVVWFDRRNAQPAGSEADVYGYDLSTQQEFRVTSKPENIGPPAVSGGTVVWSTQRDGKPYLLGYDIKAKREFTIAQASSFLGPLTPSIDGDLVVWSGKGDLDEDIFGYDLKQGKQFIVTRAAGIQIMPRISGKTVVWTDSRNGGVGKNESDADIFGARLDPGPAPVPPVIGAPASADAKIEIVWPQGGAPVTGADKANISVWLFQPGALKLAACQWSPRVELWRALNNEPAKLIALGQKYGDVHYANGRGIPSWEFNDVDVSAARDPANKYYFYVAIDGVPGRTNVWAHGADARTFFPRQDTPGGIAQAGAAVDAKIEIVWPHGNAPVNQAKQVNITAALFAPGTLLSVPAEFSPTVRLIRSLNNDVGQAVATGQKRLVGSPQGQYPVWDFNDIDVSAANDPVNKYYFTLSVDGVNTATNVWVHGADARTYFPQVDAPVGDCRGS